jgi:hypothetical protein
MHTNTKATPKSCGCPGCKRGKGSTRSQHSMRLAERAFRHAMKQALRFPTDNETRQPAPMGGYYD